ncbi:MAG: hypothetical protein M3O90_06185, partial [Actinomycetota bacterium]|nr:hypothetical protein [Actinomycetota bacterium]
ALLIAFIALADLVYNSGYRLLFGGYSPGPRFLIPALPFLVLGLTASFRRFPASTAVLAVCSALTMITVTVTNPELAWDRHWLNRIVDGSFAGFGIVPLIPFFLLVGAIAFLVCRMYLPAWPARDEAPAAATLFVGWALLAVTAPKLLDGSSLAALGVLALAAVVALASAAIYRAGWRSARPAPRR